MTAPAINFDTSGPVQEAMRRAILGRMKASGGTVNAEVNVVAGGSRGADLNQLIAAVQAGHGRNPWYLEGAARDAVRILVHRMAGAPESVDFLLRQIGRIVLDGVKENVDRQANKGGRAFKGLTPNYAAAKRRKFGFVVPILKATGDLLGGLRVVTRRS